MKRVAALAFIALIVSIAGALAAALAFGTGPLCCTSFETRPVHDAHGQTLAGILASLARAKLGGAHR
jgi:hypothetical protein